MKNKVVVLIGIGCLLIGLAGCSKSNNEKVDSSPSTSNQSQTNSTSSSSITDATIHFGQEGEEYTIEFEKNATALELAKNIGTSGKQLPIYNFDNFEGYKFYQYYDIPSSFTIPSNPETVQSEKAGDIYYSLPNRVIVFYQDAQIEGIYTKVGHIKDITGLKEAVEKNPVLEGWGNKIVLLNYAE